MFDFVYKLKQSTRARGVSITIKPDGEVLVTRPAGADPKEAERFVWRKREWIQRKVEYFLKHPYIRLWREKGRSGKKNYAENKERARTLVNERLEFFNTRYNFEYDRVFIKNLRSRWGSCSKKKNLNFNYRIVFLPPELADYLVVHELCHLGEFNHSQAFWSLVSRAIPDYKKLRAELKQIGI